MGLFSRNFQIKFNLHKTYFDIGYGLTQYFKYLILLFGVASLNVKSTMFIAVVYAIGCYILGWAWLHSGFFSAAIEIGNMFNPFVTEMREAHQKKKRA